MKFGLLVVTFGDTSIICEWVVSGIGVSWYFCCEVSINC